MDIKLKELRESMHLSQKTLGNEIGLSQQVISRIERDSRTMTLEHLLLLSNFFNVSTDYFLGKTKAMRNLEGQQAMLEAMQKDYELVQAYQMLGSTNRELLWALLEKMLEQESR